MEKTDPTINANYLIVGDRFCKKELIFNETCAALSPLISIIIDLEAKMIPRNSIFLVGIIIDSSSCTMKPSLIVSQE